MSRPFFSKSERHALLRFVERVCGVVVFSLSLALLLALISYDPYDPGVYSATWESPKNWLGWPGAAVADVLVRTLGLAAFAVAIYGVVRAERWIGGRPSLAPAGRVIFAPFAAMAIAAFASAHGIEAAAGGGLGGVIGDFLFGVVAVGLPVYTEKLRMIVATLLWGGATIGLTLATLGATIAGVKRCADLVQSRTVEAYREIGGECARWLSDGGGDRGPLWRRILTLPMQIVRGVGTAVGELIERLTSGAMEPRYATVDGGASDKAEPSMTTSARRWSIPEHSTRLRAMRRAEPTLRNEPPLASAPSAPKGDDDERVAGWSARISRGHVRAAAKPKFDPTASQVAKSVSTRAKEPEVSNAPRSETAPEPSLIEPAFDPAPAPQKVQQDAPTTPSTTPIQPEAPSPTRPMETPSVPRRSADGEALRVTSKGRAGDISEDIAAVFARRVRGEPPMPAPAEDKTAETSSVADATLNAPLPADVADAETEAKRQEPREWTLPPRARRSSPEPAPRADATPSPSIAPTQTTTFEQAPDVVDAPIVETQEPEAPTSEAPAAPDVAATVPALIDPLPPIELLSEPRPEDALRMTEHMLHMRAERLQAVLKDYGIKGDIIDVHPGPVVTLFELEPAPGLKASRVVGLADDIARSMSAVSARVSTVPGRNIIGIELPNDKRETVRLRELISHHSFKKSDHPLTLALGKDIAGEPVVANLARMPHLLIAGTTGSGKSVGINTMLLSLLYRLSPEEVRLILIDPKMLELSVYNEIPHLISPVVTDPKKAVLALKWAVREMEQRYEKMARLNVRGLDSYNEKVAEARAKGTKFERTVQTGFDDTSGAPIYETQTFEPEPMPRIVIVVDEMADLMMVAGKEIEHCIQRLAQMARASGIHLIMATQRPSVDVITGTVKANFPIRISFQVTSKIDSRTILGEQGAEQLLGRGDMLYNSGAARLTRVHGAFVSDDEVASVVRHLRSIAKPDYLVDFDRVENETSVEDAASMGGGDDELYDRAVAIVASERKASTSFIQRRLQIGYNRAARIIEMMEEQGVVSPANHVGKREVLIGQAE